MSGRGCRRFRQRSFELDTADLASRPGAAMVGLNVCENGAGLMMPA